MKLIGTLFFALIWLIHCPATLALDTPYLAELNEKIHKNPKNHSALADRGFAYSMLGLKSAAYKDYKKALQLYPNDSFTRWSYGWAAFNLSDYKRALKEWNAVITERTTRPWWTGHTLALCYWKLGNKELAMKFYDEAVRTNPKKFSTRKDLLAYTDFWAVKERETLEQIYDAWRRVYKVDQIRPR